MNNYREILSKTTIGSLVLENRILQAPLAGYSNMPFRLMCWECGHPGMLATEMISAKSLSYARDRNEFYLLKHKDEGPLQYQLWGTEPEYFASSAKICEERGASAIDINCGCPVRKVNASGSGVSIMHKPELIGQCISAMKKAVKIPVSAKIRIGPTREKWNGIEIAKIAEDSGADFITVHGRHGKESYNVPARYDEIKKIVEAVKIPVFGNGDVRDGQTAAKMLENTECFGIMVGRGCMGNPWIFDKIKTELSGETWQQPSGLERGKVVLKNYEMLVELMGEEPATRHIRKLACFYSKGLTGSREFRMDMNYISDRKSFVEHVNKHFHG